MPTSSAASTPARCRRGKILALVLRANHSVSFQPSLDAEMSLTTVETVVRHLLTERLATIRHAPAPVQPVA